MSLFTHLRFSALIAALTFPFAAKAALLTISNPSFESPGVAPANFTGGMTFGPTNWQVYNAGETNGYRYFGVWNPATTDSYFDPIDGANVGVVFLNNDFSLAEAGLRQTLSDTLQLSTQYTLTVAVGNFKPNPSAQWDFTGFPGYRIDLMAGSTVIASDNNTLQPGEGRFLTSTVSFTTGGSHPNAGQSLGIRLVNLNGPGTEVNFDNVRLDAVAVPEPASLGLIAIGTALVAFTRRRSC